MSASSVSPRLVLTIAAALVSLYHHCKPCLWGRTTMVAGVLICQLAIAMAFCTVCDAADPARVEFFEKRIRPVLVQSCYECHAGDETEANEPMRLQYRYLDLRRGPLQRNLILRSRVAKALDCRTMNGLFSTYNCC